MDCLRGKLLISSERLGDPNFNRTVILMLLHNDEGALGLVLNRPLPVSLVALSRQIIGQDSPREGVVHQGGPCEAAVMVVFDDEASPDGGTEVSPGIRFSGDSAVITPLLRQPGGEARFFAGYSGWGAGQLESEMSEQAWLTLAARREHVFADPDRLWDLVRAELVLGYRVNPDAIPTDPTMN